DYTILSMQDKINILPLELRFIIFEQLNDQYKQYSLGRTCKMMFKIYKKVINDLTQYQCYILYNRKPIRISFHYIKYNRIQLLITFDPRYSRCERCKKTNMICDELESCIYCHL